MKRVFRSFAAILCIIAGLLLTACRGGDAPTETDVYEKALSYKKNSNQATVFTPMSERPVYVLSEGAGIEEMREMAVKVMYDELSFLWTPLESFTYTKTGAGANGVYYFASDTVYAGLPYTNAGLSLFHALDLYDPDNGVLYGVEGDPNMVLGNNCAPSVNWGLSAVCTNISASDTGSMCLKNGFLPVGGYNISDVTERFSAAFPTQKILEREGLEKMCEYYAQVVTADAVMTCPVGSHAMMAIEPAHVVKGENGKIDPSGSYLVVQDQRFGEKSINLQGQTVSYRGRYDAKVSFQSLFDEGYIPLRASELSEEGHKYVPSEVKLSAECNSFAELKKAQVLSNFRVCKIEGKLISDSGKTVLLKRAITGINDYYSGGDRNMDASRVLPSESEAAEAMVKGHNYRFLLTCLTADGKETTVFEREVRADFFK